MRFIGRAVAPVLVLSLLTACQGQVPVSQRTQPVNPLEVTLRYHAAVARQDGIAAAVLMDTSGSMSGSVTDFDGQSRPKIEIARRAAIDCVRQFEDYSRKNPDRKVLVGIYEFSARDKAQSCRQVVRLGLPDSAAATPAINAMMPSGGTPIGNAMIQAKLELDLTGMSRRHILVITDGQNNRGYSPGDVASALSRIPEEERASLYFIAFDTGADQFNAVKDAGGLVLAASSGGDLKQTLDFVLTGKILVEQPVAPASR